ncbi:MAG: PHP domain-containing protein [Ruminococcus sp.]|jgi:PHP family Zn ribbon phosphoesterase|nr:PHP domain-containing protein [Ruminococcus sp.]
MKLSYDLHIHSCLSPCGSDDSLPSNIVGMAALKGLDVIAVTDHNSCGNCKAVSELAAEYGILAIPGMELTTAEEAHVLCLFYNIANAEAFSEYVYKRLLNFPNDEKIFGKQQYADKDDNIYKTEPLLLISATSIGFDEVYKTVTDFGGIMIPAHIDKSTTSLLSNMGFIPPDSEFKCAEIKHTGFTERLISENPYLKNCNIITDSDAHYLEDISEPEHFLNANEKTVKGVLDALMKKQNG